MTFQKEFSEEVVVSLQSTDPRISACDAPAAESLPDAFRTVIGKLFVKHFMGALHDMERDLESQSKRHPAENMYQVL